MAFSSYASTPSVAASQTDPILAALARHREAWANLVNAAPEDAAGAIKAQVMALAVVIATPCTTPAGTEGLLRHLRVCLASNGVIADVLAHVAAAAEAVAQQVPAQGEAEPVLLLIEDHRAAYEAWDRLDKIAGEFLPPGSENDAAQAAAMKAGRREREAFDALMAAQPSTLPGLVALADYLPDAIERLSISDDEHDAERALRNVAGALRDLVQCASATSGAL